MFWRATHVLKLRRKNSCKKTFVILAALTFGICFLNWLPKTRQSTRFERELDFHPIQYTSLAPCERQPNGDFNCPDIRRKGTTLLRQAQLVLTRILRIFDLIAKKYGIKYWLYRGTLLGAVRHHGHVPFDNDVDICIPKEDFEKFIKYGVKELPDDIFFQTEETDVHWKVPYCSNMLGKLRDTRSCIKHCMETGCKHKDGLMLDLFVVENDSKGNFIEMYTSDNWFLRGYIYDPILRKQSDIFPLTEINFDGFYLPAPREWKKVLKSLYGDFLKIPAFAPLGQIITDTLHSCEEIS